LEDFKRRYIILSTQKIIWFVLSRTPAAKKPVEHTNGAEVEITPASTPRTQDRTYTDDEMLRLIALVEVVIVVPVVAVVFVVRTSSSSC